MIVYEKFQPNRSSRLAGCNIYMNVLFIILMITVHVIWVQVSIEMDRFLVQLKSGDNYFKRDSNRSPFITKSPLPLGELQDRLLQVKVDSILRTFYKEIVFTCLKLNMRFSRDFPPFSTFKCLFLSPMFSFK